MTPIISLAASVGAIAVYLRFRRTRPPRHNPLSTQPQCDALPTMWLLHEPPEVPFTVGGAIMAMRGHDRCPDSCRRKAAAAGTLNAAGVNPSLGLR